MNFDYEFDVSGCCVERWVNSMELDNYCRSFIRELPIKTPGIYYIYKGGELLYVGCSINMISRLISHLSLNSNSKEYINEADYVACEVIEDKDEREIREYTQICDLKPTRNRQLPKLTEEQKRKMLTNYVTRPELHEALTEIDTHIRSTHDPIPHIIETLKRTLPEYGENHANHFTPEQIDHLFANPDAKHVELDENGRVLNVTAEEVARELGEENEAKTEGDE